MKICYNCFNEIPDSAGTCPHCGSSTDLRNADKYPHALPCGSVLNGRYIVGRVLGQGGFGITYVGQVYKTKKLVAIKEYFPDTMAARDATDSVMPFNTDRRESFEYGKKQFLDEAKTLSAFIGSPNIVRVYSYFEENGTAYFVMEYVRGTSLRQYVVSRGGRIPWKEARDLLMPVLDALSEVHSKKIVHRDIKPDNIIITESGSAKLIDFGAARYSHGEKSKNLTAVLTPGYASPEQYYSSGDQGAWTDIYAIAATMYFCITGNVPMESVERLVKDTLRKPSELGISIPEYTETALMKALADYAHALPCGSVLAGRYVVGNVLRVDGSGITYTAQEYPTETIVAIREFFPQGAAKREAPNRVIPCSEMHMEIFERGKEQFFEETGILAEFIDHPDIIRISSCFEENGTAYYVTEKIDGISLKEYLEGGKLSFYESLQILIPVMNALISMHEKGIVHRDISPAGIYINSDGSVKLLEFSAAVRTGCGQEQKLDNTVRPGFSPLEQYISLQKAGPWTDVYALAVTLYRCITGSMPPDPISRVKNDSQIPAGLAGTDLPKDAEAVLLKALALRYEDRYQSVQEFKEAIIGDRAQELLLSTQSRHRWPDVDTLEYLKRIGKESIANRMFDVHVSVSETESSLKPADSSNSFFAKFFHPRSTVVNQNIPNKEKTMTVTLQGWQTSGDAILALKEKGLLPDLEYIFTDWPEAKSVMRHPVYNRWQACVCELKDKVYHVTEYSSRNSPRRMSMGETLYGCPNVKELEGRKLSKTVEVLDFQ